MILCLCPNPAIDMYIWLNTFAAGQVNIPQKEERFPGGKGVHVALAVAELGEPVMLLGFWGGPTGQWVREKCEALGIACYGPDVSGWTRTCLSFKGENNLDDTELLGIGPSISEADFENFLKIFVRLVTSADLVTMSGSWPQGAPPDAYAQILALAHTARKHTVLDCAGEQLQQALKQKPLAVHVNRREGESLFREADPVHLAALLAERCTYAAVTAGADGLYLAAPNEFIQASCTLDNIFSAVGSGDCLVAGLAVAFIRGMALTEVARLGVACGSANCLRPELGMLHRSDVERLQPQVKIKQQEKIMKPLNYSQS
ncbi:tagatose-6-phosphate kinase [Adhaeribacter aerolatus]|uniref:Tagatose-6-phosphate kinase n=1 Tax=Adhaeribacter aerolatus TaxID=670289 RepID=A0A512B3D4_9BACT|nr:1-phosphofructokinase family hexose kinase [Adhaeribacter aerolatus]GEO06475.1 tagatose-6-phosphate kinase [Adhaeribacter aerolatus]